MSGARDTRQLRALMGAYLRMSLRGKTAATFFRRSAGRWRGTVALTLLYGAIGSVAAYGASGSRDPFSYALVMHAITFVMLGMSLAAESGDLLFPAAEHEILGHLPLGTRSLLVSKAASLMGFALLLALSLNVPALVLATRLPWLRASFLPGHLVAVVLLAAFAAAILVFSYGLIVRFVGRRRFDTVAAWSQAALLAAFLGLSQGLAYLVELPVMRLDATFCLAFPPAWFAAIDVLAAGVPSSRAAALSLLAVGTTAILGWAAITRLTPGYGEVFVRLGEAEAPRTPADARRPVGRLLARWWLRDPVERAAFRLAASYMRRNREIKTRLYPSLGFFVVLPAAQLFSHVVYRFTAAALVSAILLGMIPSVVLEALRVSSHSRAAELFAVSPIASAGALFEGVRKAAMFYVVLPAALIAVVWIVVLDPLALWLAAPTLIALPLLSMLPAALRQYVPLSIPPTTGRQSFVNILLGLITTTVGGATVGLAWAAWRLGYLPQFIALEVLLVALAVRAVAARIRTRPLR